MSKNKNIESEFASIREAAIGESPEPKISKSTEQVVSETYQRGKKKIAELTGRKVEVPTFNNGVMAYPPAERMLRKANDE